MYVLKNALLIPAMLLTTLSSAQKTGDEIIGRWHATEKTLSIEIYRSGTEYRARILDFTDHHTTIPASARKDEKNPDPGLRKRSILGIDVLTGLQYDPEEKSWTDGNIYDVSSGRQYRAELELDGSGRLEVRAYKGVSMLGKTLHFVR